eukprot:517781-Hanusia_phi.AAC.1
MIRVSPCQSDLSAARRRGPGTRPGVRPPGPGPSSELPAGPGPDSDVTIPSDAGVRRIGPRPAGRSRAAEPSDRTRSRRAPPPSVAPPRPPYPVVRPAAPPQRPVPKPRASDRTVGPARHRGAAARSPGGPPGRSRLSRHESDHGVHRRPCANPVERVPVTGGTAAAAAGTR